MSFFKEKKVFFWGLFLFCVLISFGVKEVLAQEIKYPQIPGASPPTSQTNLPDYIKYIYNFIIILSGLIALGGLILGGVKWMLSKGDVVKLSSAKKQVFSALIGLLIVLGANLILNYINPQLTWIKFKKEKTAFFPSSFTLNPPQYKKIIVATRIPLGSLTKESVKHLIIPSPSSPSFFSEKSLASVSKGFYVSFGKKDTYLGGYVPQSKGEFDKSSKKGEEMIGIMDEWEEMAERVKENIDVFKVTISDVEKKLNNLLEIVCEREDRRCVVECDEDDGENCFEDPPCGKISGISEFKNLVLAFKSRENPNIDKLEGEMKEKLRELFSDLRLENNQRGFLLTYLNERYDFKTQDLVDEIVDKANNLKITNFCSEEDKKIIEKRLEDLRKTTELFKEGYKIRGMVWNVLPNPLEIAEEIDKYRHFKKENLVLEGFDYFHEGVVSPTLMDRAWESTQRLKEKASQIYNISEVAKRAAQTIAVLTGTCNCMFCGCACGSCVGDPCPARPMIVASQIVLGTVAATLPVLTSQLQRELVVFQTEKRKIKQSLEEMTQGLLKGKRLLEECSGDNHALLSFNEFLMFKERAQKLGYEIEIRNPWPEIPPNDDPYTFYCVKKEPRESFFPYSVWEGYNPPFSGRAFCEREIEVGEMIKKIDFLIEGNNQLLDQMTNIESQAQKIITKASNNTPSQTLKDELLRLMEENTPLGGELSREILISLSKGELTPLLISTIESLPEKYAKEVAEYIFKETPIETVSEIARSTIDFLSAPDLKKILENEYFRSLTNQQIRIISETIIESLPSGDLKLIAEDIISAIKGPDLKETIINILKRAGEERRKRMLFMIFSKLEENQIFDLYLKVMKNLPESEVKDFLKVLLREYSIKKEELISGNVLKTSPSQPTQTQNQTKKEDKKETIQEKEWIQPERLEIILKDLPGTTIEEKIDNIPKEEVFERTKRIGEVLYKKGVLKTTILVSVKSDIWFDLIRNLPSSQLKEIVELMIKGLPEDELGDFLLYEVLKADPRIFEEISHNLPSEKLKDVLKKSLSSIENSDIQKVREILKEGIEVLNQADPRNILNFIILKYGNDSTVLQALRVITNKTYDEFLMELADVLPEQVAVAKDILDKISSEINDLASVIDELLKAIPLEKLRLLLMDVYLYTQIPESLLRHIFEDVIKSLPAPLLEKIAREILVKFIPTKELKRVIRELLSLISDKQFVLNIEKVLEKTPEEKLGEVLDEVLKKIATSKEKMISALKILLSWIPDVNLPFVFAEIGKYLPTSFLKEFFKSLINPVVGIKKILTSVFSKLPQKVVEDTVKKVVKVLGSEKMQNLLGMFSQYLPDKVLMRILGTLINFTKQHINKALEIIQKYIPKIPFDKLDQLLSGIYISIPGMKQSIKNLIVLPPQFTCGKCGCDCPPSPCFGINPPGPWSDVIREMGFVVANAAGIRGYYLSLFQSFTNVKRIINIEIKRDIYSTIDATRAGLQKCIVSSEHPTSFYQLFKCKDALRYGWVSECGDGLNFLCCTPTK